jgi:hypothetical protein
MRRLLAALLTLLITGWAVAQTPATQAADKPADDRHAGKKAAAKPAKKASAAPQWAELNAEQQHILSPLKIDWENLTPERRRKWIGIAKRYPDMQPLEQQRVQERMQRWANLSPQQRAQARENYKRMAKASAEKRRMLREQWAAYQSLSPQERQNLAPRSEPIDLTRPKHQP